MLSNEILALYFYSLPKSFCVYVLLCGSITSVFDANWTLGFSFFSTCWTSTSNFCSTTSFLSKVMELLFCSTISGSWTYSSTSTSLYRRFSAWGVFYYSTLISIFCSVYELFFGSITSSIFSSNWTLTSVFCSGVFGTSIFSSISTFTSVFCSGTFGASTFTSIFCSGTFGASTFSSIWT